MNIDLSFDPNTFLIGMNYYPSGDGYIYNEFNIFLLFFRLSIQY
jgi:hypothetical protein